MQLNRSLILNIFFGTRNALFISFVRSVLKCKGCPSSKQNSTKIVYPLVKENKRIEISVLLNYRRAFKRIMANPSQKEGKEGNSPLQYVKRR